MLLAIDPGIDTGWALFGSDRRLVACGLGDPRMSDKHRISDIDSVIIECPFIYPRGQTKNPNAVVTLAINAGEWGGRYNHLAIVEYIFPFKWKGTVPKDIHHERVWARLDPNESECLTKSFKNGYFETLGDHERAESHFTPRAVPPSKRHNVLDAVGLGMWKLGRMP